LSRLRCSNHSLLIETGRMNNIELPDRICPLCHCDIEDEYHMLLICPLYDLRVNLPRRFTVNPIRFKFNSLMRSNQLRTIKSLAFYVYHAFSLREMLLNRIKCHCIEIVIVIILCVLQYFYV
jgi:hypothetical protein